MECDLDYYRRRLAEERDSAAEADRADVRSVHEKLARMYKARIDKLTRGSQAGVPGKIQAPPVATVIGSGA